MGKPADPSTDRPPNWIGLLATDGGEPSAEDFPPAWHGGPSWATTVLLPFGVSAAKFVRAPLADREALLDALFDRNARRLIGQTILCSCIALGCLVSLPGRFRLFALAGCLVKAASDLARFFGRRKALLDAAELTEEDLEIDAPREE